MPIKHRCEIFHPSNNKTKDSLEGFMSVLMAFFYSSSFNNCIKALDSGFFVWGHRSSQERDDKTSEIADLTNFFFVIMRAKFEVYALCIFVQNIMKQKKQTIIEHRYKVWFNTLLDLDFSPLDFCSITLVPIFFTDLKSSFTAGSPLDSFWAQRRGPWGPRSWTSRPRSTGCCWCLGCGGCLTAAVPSAWNEIFVSRLFLVVVSLTRYATNYLFSG